jgi:hypothetical protein
MRRAQRIPAMTLRAIIVFLLLAAIVVPIALAEMRRFRPRAAARPARPRPPKREAPARPPLRLVVDKNDMDRELAALLAKDSRKTREADE